MKIKRQTPQRLRQKCVYWCLAFVIGVQWWVHRQERLPFGDGVVSGMAMTMSNSPAVAAIARVRKAAL